MSSCEKCWWDAHQMSRLTGISQPECYRIVLEKRKNNPCTPREQAGQFWDNEKLIDIRCIEEVKE